MYSDKASKNDLSAYIKSETMKLKVWEENDIRAYKQIKSVDDINTTGFYIGTFSPGYSWQIGFAIFQEDCAGILIAIDSIRGIVFAGHKANSDEKWAIKKIFE